MNQTVTTSVTPQQVQQLLARLPDILAGKVPDTLGIAREIQLRLGVALLGQIQQAFLVKAQGGTGSDGIRWQPLKPETIARRRQGPADRKALTQKARYQGLTESQKKALRKDINRRKAELILRGTPPQRAETLARILAEQAMRRQGGKVKSKFEVLAGRRVEILRDTGELLRTLSPGTENRPSGEQGQIFDITPGQVVVGSSHKHAIHHEGIPSRNVPARPFWPEDLPDSWMNVLLETVQKALLRVLTERLTQRRV